MDVDAPPESTAQPLADVEDDQANWEIEKAEMKRNEFNINQELIDARSRVEDLSQSNSRMVEEAAQHAKERNEQIERQRLLEAERNELTDRNLELETAVARLKIEKEERDAVAVNATKLAQSAQVETYALKDEIHKLTSEHANFKHTKEALEREVHSIQFERQKFQAERDLHAESKKWLMQEVAERDNKVSTLRLEISSKEVQASNERLQYIRDANILSSQVESLNEQLDMLKFKNSELLKRIEDTELSKANEIANLEGEIRCQLDLQRVMKTSMEEAKNAADTFKNQLEARENVLIEVQNVLVETQEDMERRNAAHADVLRERDEELAQTRAELAKVSEMMKSMSDVKLNVSEEELSELAPAAAETVRYLRGGQSLSGLVLEHARVRGKLAEVESDNANLRNALEELLETLDLKTPQFETQRRIADELFIKNTKFEEQLGLAESERRELLGQRDSAQRDLAYVRAELEKYQRDFEFVSRRNAELMYAVERQSRVQDPNWNEQADELLFQNIVQLQRRNVELESDIENAKASAAQAAINAQCEEMAQLRADLSVTKKSEAELKTRVEQTKAAFDSLKERTEHFKELVRDSVTAAEARTARLRAEEAVAAKIVADATVERLRSQIEEYKADHAKREKDLEQKLHNSEANIACVTETNIKLNAMLDAQKTNTAAIEQEYKSALKEKDTAMEELRKITIVDAEKDRQLVEYSRKILEAADQSGSLRVRVRALEDELQSARTEANSLKMTADGQKAILETEEKVRMSVVEMANFLSRVEAEKLTHANTQVEILRHERDSLKASTTRFSDQLTHMKNEAKLIQQRLEKELEVAKSRLAEKEQQLIRDGKELVDLRSKLNLLNNQSSSGAAGMTPDRLKREYMQLKTRAQFLENELDDAKRKLLEAETTQKRMDAEHAISASHSNVMEENLKQNEQMGNMEKERLLAHAKCFEDRAQQLADTLAKTQTEFDELHLKYDEQAFRFDTETAELRRQLEVASLNLENVKRDLDMANNSLLGMRNEAARNAEALEQHNTIVRQFQDRISEFENDRLRLQAELNNKSLALVAETTAKNEADQMREHVERLLQRKIDEMALLEEQSQQKQAENDERLAQLSVQYESLSSTVTERGSLTSMNEDGEVHSNMIANLQSLVQVLRESKNDAITRALVAEVEMKRLHAETAEFEKGRNELLQKIRDLETEKIATTASLVDRANLIEQVQSLTAVHNINTQLTEEKAKLQAQLVQIQKEKTDLERLKGSLLAKLDEQKLKIASSDNEAIQRKKEIEQLKQRAQPAARLNALQAQSEQYKTQLNAARQEIQTLSDRCKVLETEKAAAQEKNADLTSKLNQTRQLAIKFRDENLELKKQHSGPVGDNDPCGPRLAVQSKIHADEVAKLNGQIENLKKEIENLNMKVLRVSVLEKTLKKTADQMSELKQQNERLSESNRHLTQNQSVSATDVESKTTTPSTPRAAVTTRQTPTKLSDPNSAASKQPTEPDQAGVQKGVPQLSVVPPRRIPLARPPAPANVVPPAPEPTNTSQHKISPSKRPVPPSIPNEPLDVIPPVPSDNIPDPTPSASSFGSNLPVPHAFQASVRVPTQSLFSSSSTTTVQPQTEKKNVLPSIDSAPSTPGSNTTNSLVTTTSSLHHGQQLFGSSGGVSSNISTSSSVPKPALPEESVAEGAAGQSSLVSGSIDQPNSMETESAANGIAICYFQLSLLTVLDGESRDSTTVSGVSSSDGRRKRTANDFQLNEAKRQRESPNEAVTSSETRPQVADIPELDEDEVVLGMEHEVSDEDPNDTIQERRQDVIDLENDEEVLEDDMEGEEGDDDSLGNDEEYDDEGEALEENDDDVVVLSDGDDGSEENDDVESLNDVDEDDDVEEIRMAEGGQNNDIEEVLEGEDSQPSLDDQDREAASAVEEAEDEGRDPLAMIDEPSAPADPTGAAGIGISGRMGQDVQRVRLPTGLREAEREDQCSSSNETNEERPAQQLTARNLARLQRPTRGAKPTRGVYTPNRGNRGGRGGGTA
uniref:TPR_MLP1_2 domain-containing protein n=1 Tax=Caenorhabditis tropicalis TaxID=1561998 RepID=A0A1I7TLW4_9PELO